MVDLINDTLTIENISIPKVGETFGKALRETNVPKDLIVNEERWRYIRLDQENT